MMHMNEQNRAFSSLGVYVLRGMGYMSSGAYVLRSKCPGGKRPGGKCSGDICPWGKRPGEGGTCLQPTLFKGARIRGGRPL